MKAHSSKDCDSEVLDVKVTLAKSRLFGVRRPVYIDWIMSQVWEAEKNTGVAQEQLCELLDDAMFKLDHTHPDWRPDSHWCTRWGSLSSDSVWNG